MRVLSTCSYRLADTYSRDVGGVGGLIPGDIGFVSRYRTVEALT